MASKPNQRNSQAKDRRAVERRAPKKGVTIRHDDPSGYVPKRVRRGAK